MAIDTYSTARLLGAYGVIDRPVSFLYDTFFTSEQTFDTEEVYFDKVERARRLAPIVSPAVQGKAERLRGYYANSFRPAYVKPKHVIEPWRTLRRRPGEALLGELSLAERRDRIVIDTLQVQDDQITRREEYMAAQMLLTGAVTVVGEDYPAQVVDMGRPAGNTVALTGAARWGQSGVDPMVSIQAWSALLQNASGFAPTKVIMDPLAWALFLQSSTVARVMNSFRQTTGNVDLAGTAVGGVGGEAVLGGTVGQFEFYVYQQFYTDDLGNVLKFMPDNSVIMGNPAGCQGTRLYGAIQDVRSLVALPRYPKMWVTEDPSAEFMMTQSAPLPVLGWSEATFAATVA
ncbi:major capsid protein [Methylobacterium mesophilicum]